MATRFSLSGEDAKYCLTKLREQSPDLYLSCLLLAEEIRSPVTVLHTFHSEITRITLAAPEPLAGEVRLQWWMDALNRQRDDEAALNPLARSLLALIEEHNLPTSVLVSKLEAHIFDLYSDPMDGTRTLEAYLGETRSVLFQLAALIADSDGAPAASDASGHAGMATGCVAILENLARHRAQRRAYLPSDMLKKCGTSVEQLLTNVDTPQTNAVLAFADTAEEHHHRAKAALEGVSTAIRPVFAPLTLVPLYLTRIRKNPQKTLTGMPPISQIRRQWALWRG
ncbi:MAG: phytoene/squalene synthase family protein [Rhizobiaceae bacterium]